MSSYPSSKMITHHLHPSRWFCERLIPTSSGYYCILIMCFMFTTRNWMHLKNADLVLNETHNACAVTPRNVVATSLFFPKAIQTWRWIPATNLLLIGMISGALGMFVNISYILVLSNSPTIPSGAYPSARRCGILSKTLSVRLPTEYRWTRKSTNISGECPRLVSVQLVMYIADGNTEKAECKGHRVRWTAIPQHPDGHSNVPFISNDNTDPHIEIRYQISY